MMKNYNIRKQAGDKQESDVAYQLDRLLKKKECKIIHDLRLTDGEYNAQIDHLIIHKYGFVIIESKSIKGSVTVNQQGEWTRSVGNRWEGMPSPIKQVEMQYKMLNAVLEGSAPQLLGKWLGLQKYLGGRINDIIIAISSNAIFDRKEAPKATSELVLKTEFVSDHVNTLMKRCGGVLSSHPWFTDKEFANIYEHLIYLKECSGNEVKNDKNMVSLILPAPKESERDDSTPVVWAKPQSSNQVTAKIKKALLHCKSCSSSDDLKGAYGKFGYYIQCGCGTNTSMKLDCISCSAPKSKVKIKKKGQEYSGNCSACQHVFQIGSFKPV
ncbi:MAG: transcription elongation factor Elf1 [Oleiphilaceae bacterium]|jgi:transcription elongation factor Elf1